MNCFQVQRKKSSRFSMIITEINKHNLTSYRTVLVTFVNSIIAGVHNIMDRVNIRNEFLCKRQFIVDFYIITDVFILIDNSIDVNESKRY